MDQVVAEAREAFDDAVEGREGESAEDILGDARDAFDRAVEAEAENRAEALDDLRFARLGEQWPDHIRKQRERQKRPCLTINKLPAFTRQVVNDSRQNRPSIVVRPADSSADPRTALVYNGLIRNIEVTSNADVAYDTALEYAVDCGFGYLRVTTEPTHDDSFDLDLRIKRVSNPFSIYGDPDSTAADSEDWMVAFVTEMLRKEAFLAKYPGAETSSWGQAGQGDSTGWFDGDMVRVAEYWRRYEDKSTILQLSNGAILDAEMYIAQRELFDMAGLQVTGTRDTRTFRVIQRIISGAEVLSEEKWAGKYIPIVPVFGDEVNVEGKRYFRSLIRDAKDPQRNFNYWRTTATELLALAPKAPWIGPKGFTKDNEGKWASANTENHAYLEYTGQVPPQRVPFDGPPAGALQESLNASDDMKSIMGIYDASLGARSNETSGVAITARQREGDVSTFHFIDNLSRAIRHTGKILIDMIPRVYNGPRIVRILGEDGTPSNVPINQQVPMPDGKVGVFDLTAGKYDLVVESGPSFSTRRQEAAQQMIEFMRVQPQAGALIGDLLAKNLDWPGAEEIAQRLRAMLPPQLQGQDPQVQQMQQQLQQLQQQSQQAQQQSQQIIQALQMEIARLKGDMTVKQQEANTKAFAAETDRFEATAAAMTPQQIQLLVMQTVQQLLGSPDILPGAAPQAAPPQPPLQSPAMPVAAPPSMQQMSGPSPGQGPGQLFSGGPQAFR